MTGRAPLATMTAINGGFRVKFFKAPRRSVRRLLSLAWLWFTGFACVMGPTNLYLDFRMSRPWLVDAVLFALNVYFFFYFRARYKRAWFLDDVIADGLKKSGFKQGPDGVWSRCYVDHGKTQIVRSTQVIDGEVMK